MFKPVFAAFLALLPMGAMAAPVASPVLDVPLATADVVSFDGLADLLAFDAPATGQGFAVPSDLLADLTLTYDMGHPYDGAQGVLAFHSGGRTLLDGVLWSVLPQTDALFLVFGDLTGDLAAVFGDGLRVGLVFFDPLGDDPLAALADGGRYDFALTVEAATQPAPVPLPAGGLLLISACG
ncbi:hypothetical protein, partial [uncultured Paracoccus sp.]|uniref:hypothetical protein n=1 Tax=uncultured Paracoccus sp. TaxID=189685 RepID=UPI0025D84F17